MKLDKWDIKLIKYLKSSGPTICGMREIWAERCNAEIDIIRVCDIVTRMAKIVQELNLASLSNLIFDAQAGNEWKWDIKDGNSANGDVTTHKSVTVYWNNWAKALGSVLMLAPIEKLPGYK